MQRFVVIGLGNFGATAARELQRLGHDVVALDIREAAVDAVASSVSRAAVGDGTSVDILRRTGAHEADAAIISTGDDITASILSALALKDCAVHTIYVKVISRDHARVMTKLDATETIFPEQESALRLSKRIATRNLVNFVQLGSGFAVQEMAVPKLWIGKSLRDLALPQTYGVSVIAVHDFLLDRYQAIPSPDASLKDSDALLVAGEEENLLRVMRLK